MAGRPQLRREVQPFVVGVDRDADSAPSSSSARLLKIVRQCRPERINAVSGGELLSLNINRLRFASIRAVAHNTFARNARHDINRAAAITPAINHIRGARHSRLPAMRRRRPRGTPARVRRNRQA